MWECLPSQYHIDRLPHVFLGQYAVAVSVKEAELRADLGADALYVLLEAAEDARDQSAQLLRLLGRPHLGHIFTRQLQLLELGGDILAGLEQVPHNLLLLRRRAHLVAEQNEHGSNLRDDFEVNLLLLAAPVPLAESLPLPLLVSLPLSLLVPLPLHAGAAPLLLYPLPLLLALALPRAQSFLLLLLPPLFPRRLLPLPLLRLLLLSERGEQGSGGGGGSECCGEGGRIE
mmetsp:Transcript_37726/g.89234  ORF Transcript_37726/g.89234 Transcript_37726/m.89234 type:complete len:230 (+) Transcript_37726:330-1019(+)